MTILSSHAQVRIYIHVATSIFHFMYYYGSQSDMPEMVEELSYPIKFFSWSVVCCPWRVLARPAVSNKIKNRTYPGVPRTG